MRVRAGRGRRIGGAGILGILLVLSGPACDTGTEPDPILERGTLVAQISGSREGEYRGQAEFTVPQNAEGESRLWVRSEGRFEWLTDASMRFDSSLGVPPTGTYQIEAPTLETSYDPPEGRFLATYSWSMTEWRFERAVVGRVVGQEYVARAGSVTITFSSEDIVEGNFNMEAARWCSFVKSENGLAPEGPCSMFEVADNAPTIEVTGRFSLVRSVP